ARPSTAITRRPMTSRAASGEGESLNAVMIHCSFGITTSRARIAAPPNQFTTMRIRRMTYAIGAAADDEIGFNMIYHLPDVCKSDNVATRPLMSAQLLRPLKFAAQLNRLTVWHNESKCYDMMVGVDHCDHHILQVASPRRSGDLEKTELDRLSIRRHFPLPASTIPGVTIVGREQTLPLHVEHSDLMFWGASSTCIPLMQNRGPTGHGANREVDRYVHNRALPRTRQGFHFFESLFRVRLRGGGFRWFLRHLDDGCRNKDD